MPTASGNATGKNQQLPKRLLQIPTTKRMMTTMTPTMQSLQLMRMKIKRIPAMTMALSRVTSSTVDSMEVAAVGMVMDMDMVMGMGTDITGPTMAPHGTTLVITMDTTATTVAIAAWELLHITTFITITTTPSVSLPDPITLFPITTFIISLSRITSNPTNLSLNAKSLETTSPCTTQVLTERTGKDSKRRDVGRGSLRREAEGR
eukprot:GHVQ01029036.1.p3 GENE.GHVQ01029036.1~~GHVQ01029036.1.p3  ORF type:complete len:205 (+),score=16.25 GHVQ01029036.1:391-1005(+)